jgi:hypothetical protein
MCRIKFRKKKIKFKFKRSKTKKKYLKCVEFNSKNILVRKKSEILMFRASKHDSTFQRTRFDILFKEKKVP